MENNKQFAVDPALEQRFEEILKKLKRARVISGIRIFLFMAPCILVVLIARVSGMDKTSLHKTAEAARILNGMLIPIALSFFVRACYSVKIWREVMEEYCNGKHPDLEKFKANFMNQADRFGDQYGHLLYPFEK